MSTSPFSSVRRLTCSSLPRIISIPCSVSRSTSPTSKESTSETPLIAHTSRLTKLIRCCPALLFNSSIARPPYCSLHSIRADVCRYDFRDIETSLWLLLCVQFPVQSGPRPLHPYCQTES